MHQIWWAFSEYLNFKTRIKYTLSWVIIGWWHRFGFSDRLSFWLFSDLKRQTELLYIGWVKTMKKELMSSTINYQAFQTCDIRIPLNPLSKHKHMGFGWLLTMSPSRQDLFLSPIEWFGAVVAIWLASVLEPIFLLGWQWQQPLHCRRLDVCGVWLL